MTQTAVELLFWWKTNTSHYKSSETLYLSSSYKNVGQRLENNCENKVELVPDTVRIQCVFNRTTKR